VFDRFHQSTPLGNLIPNQKCQAAVFSDKLQFAINNAEWLMVVCYPTPSDG